MEDYKLLRNIEPREYQKNIADVASERNTLVVLPTGMGKTLISVLVGINRLEKYPESKILITAPTRPLNAQHKKSFGKFTSIDPEDIVLITGKINPGERGKMYKKAKVIISTPQCVQNDLKNGRLSLEDFSFVTFDEAHRCVKYYAYTFVAKKYMEQAKHPLILGLTASPGGTYGKISEIRENLFIEAVEIRTEADGDVEPYVKPIAKELVYVELPEEFKKVKALFEDSLKDSMFWLRDHHFIQTLRPSKKALVTMQKRIGARVAQGARNYSLFWAMIRIAEAIKLGHAIELLETQGISSLYSYLKKVEKSKKRTDQRLFKDPRIREAFKSIEELNEKGIEHPKLGKLVDIVKELVEEKNDVKIIVFANYRNTVNTIDELLTKNGIKSEILVGQATRERKGLTQEKQVETLRRFGGNEFNVLIGTSVSEEGLDVPAVDFAIFYEPVASEIRSIQRRGRVGRQTAGKTIFLITKDTIDEGFFWSAFHKEKKMKGILYKMKNKTGKKKKAKPKKENLSDWVK